MNTGNDADDTNPELRLLALQSLQTWKTLIVNTVKEGKLEGCLRLETDPAKVANQIVAMLEGAVLISRLEKNRTALADAADCLKSALSDMETKF